MNLFERFEVLEDPRDVRGKKYKLIDIIIMTIYGILNKHEDFSNIAYFLELNSSYFVRLLKIECGKTPSHDCLSDIYARINPQKFMETFIEWTKDIVKIKSGAIINIDGKAVREAQDKVNGGNIPWVLDVIFNEDSSRNREGESIQNLSLVRKIVFNLVKLDDFFGKVPTNRKLTNYQHDFSNIENLIFSIVPNRA